MSRQAEGTLSLPWRASHSPPAMHEDMNTAKGKPDFGAAAGQPFSSATGAGVIPLSPAPALPSLPADLPRWDRQRAEFLHRICTWIQSRVRRGDTVMRAVRQFSARHHGRRFRGSNRTLRLSRSRLRTVFYRWRRLPSPVVLLPGFRLDVPASIRLPRPLPLAELIRASLAPGVQSLSAAFRALRAQAVPAGIPGYNRLWECLSRAQRRALLELFRSRRARSRARLTEERLTGVLARRAAVLAARQAKGSAS